MDITDRLYVQIHPLEGPHIPHPHPIDEGGFDPAYVYKVLGMYNPSETSECYFVLSNPQRQIWFIPQRHLLAFALIDSDQLLLPIDDAKALSAATGSSRETHTGSAKRGAPLYAAPQPASASHDDNADGHRSGNANGNGNGRSHSPGGKDSQDWPPRLQAVR